MLRDNTNLYTSMQSSRDPYWYNTTISELKIFVTITIYIDIFHFSTIYNYWRVNKIASITLIVIEKITRDRYILLRKYIHYSNLAQEDLITIKLGR